MLIDGHPQLRTYLSSHVYFTTFFGEVNSEYYTRSPWDCVSGVAYLVHFFSCFFVIFSSPLLRNGTKKLKVTTLPHTRYILQYVSCVKVGYWVAYRGSCVSRLRTIRCYVRMSPWCVWKSAAGGETYDFVKATIVNINSNIW